ncbi:MAG TPA: hypothetical protein VM328_09845 [Fimbriimonadaceae bacterium]|jgi:hypothetical protein|nr:hypothetical protein [Fimbriimonadaceae bacterium]
MRIRDYETGRDLSDVCISLTPEEAAELLAYLKRIVANPHLDRAHLSEVVHNRIEKEITVRLDETARSDCQMLARLALAV